MSRSEERQRLRSDDFASLRNNNSSNTRSRSRSRSRSRDRSTRRRKTKSPSNSSSRSRSPQPNRLIPSTTTTTTTSNIPTTALSTALSTNQQQQSMAAIVDTQLAQPPPSHIQYNIDETTLRKFCQPYNMEELVTMICNTAYVNREFYQILVSEMKCSSKWCKLFVHGLPWTTTQQTLYNVFSRFGEIVECVILKDRNGQSKGYGFINYSNAQEAINAINAGPQQIDGRMVGSDLAWKGRKNRQSNSNSGNSSSNNNIKTVPALSNNSMNIIGGPLALRRLFVYSLLYSTNDETLYSVFSEYGELEEAVIIKDKTNSNKSKGYGFVIFKNVSDANKALQQPHKIIDGRTVHCSLAIDGQQSLLNKQKNQQVAAAASMAQQQQQNIIIHPTINALNHVLAAQNAYDIGVTAPYQNVLYQQQINTLNNQLNNLSNHQSTQLLQQLLAQQIQQQQLLEQQQSQPNSGASVPQQQSQPNVHASPKNKAPAPIHPSQF